MKRPPLFPLLALVFAVAYACTDSAAPTRSHTLVAPTEVDGVIGKPPPPPVSTVIAVEILSPGTAVFTGVFFNNGLIHDDGSGATETFDGTAWLRFDNKQPDVGGWSGSTSANARFMVKDLNTPTGNGSLTIDGVTYTIVEVREFIRFAGCGSPVEGVPPSPCAEIQFRATDPAGGSHEGFLLAFDRSECLFGYPGKDEQFYTCPFPEVPEID